LSYFAVRSFFFSPCVSCVSEGLAATLFASLASFCGPPLRFLFLRLVWYFFWLLQARRFHAFSPPGLQVPVRGKGGFLFGLAARSCVLSVFPSCLGFLSLCVQVPGGLLFFLLTHPLSFCQSAFLGPFFSQVVPAARSPSPLSVAVPFISGP